MKIKLLKYILFLVAGIFLLTGCSVGSKLNSRYKGKSFSVVMNDLGAPTRIENLVGGGTLRIYEKKQMLRETPVNTGQFQYNTLYAPNVPYYEATAKLDFFVF